MNEYALVSEFKDYHGIPMDDTDPDPVIRRMLTRASRDMDKRTRRFFYEASETRKFDCPRSGRVLYFDWPLLSLTTLTNGNGSEITSDDYFLYPDPNNAPFLWLEIDESSGSVWEYSATPQQAIQVAGLWGWNEEYGDAWESSGATVNDDPLSSSATTLTPSGNMASFERQMILKVESEQIYISDVSETALTVERGKNGTTAAEHTQGKAISIYRPQFEVREICCRICAWRYEQRKAHFEVAGNPELVTWEVPSALPRDVVRDLARLTKP